MAAIKLSTPIVIDRKKKKKKNKRKYSPGLKDIQIFERQLTKTSLKTLRSMKAGLVSYQQAQNRSAKKKRDGAVVDFVSNVGQGMSKTLRVASPIPYDIAKVSTKTAWRITRYQIRFASQIADDILS